MLVRHIANQLGRELLLQEPFQSPVLALGHLEQREGFKGNKTHPAEANPRSEAYLHSCCRAPGWHRLQPTQASPTAKILNWGKLVPLKMLFLRNIHVFICWLEQPGHHGCALGKGPLGAGCDPELVTLLPLFADVSEIAQGLGGF